MTTTENQNPVRYFADAGIFMRWTFPDGYPDCGGWEAIIDETEGA